MSREPSSPCLGAQPCNGGPKAPKPGYPLAAAVQGWARSPWPAPAHPHSMHAECVSRSATASSTGLHIRALFTSGGSPPSSSAAIEAYCRASTATCRACSVGQKEQAGRRWVQHAARVCYTLDWPAQVQAQAHHHLPAPCAVRILASPDHQPTHRVALPIQLQLLTKGEAGQQAAQLVHVALESGPALARQGSDREWSGGSHWCGGTAMCMHPRRHAESVGLLVRRRHIALQPDPPRLCSARPCAPLPSSAAVSRSPCSADEASGC